MKRVHTAQSVACPECDHPATKVTCVENKLGRRYRYRRCQSCDHKFKTSQSMIEKSTTENIVPYLELIHLRRQELLKGGGHAKLTPSDVREIREIWEKTTFKDRDLAYRIGRQFEVEERAIDNIIKGKSWAFVK